MYYSVQMFLQLTALLSIVTCSLNLMNVQKDIEILSDNYLMKLIEALAHCFYDYLFRSS